MSKRIRALYELNDNQSIQPRVAWIIDTKTGKVKLCDSVSTLFIISGGVIRCIWEKEDLKPDTMLTDPRQVTLLPMQGVRRPRSVYVHV